MSHDLSWADAYAGNRPFLSEIFAIAFVRDVPPLDALRRVGGLPDTLADRTPQQMGELHDYEHGYPDVASAQSFGEWTVLVEPNGFWIANLADALSHGTEAVTVLRHDYASHAFAYAVDGRTVTGFNLNYPDMRHGTDPDRLLAQMREAGFDPDDTDGQYGEAVSNGLRLAELLTGVAPTLDQVTASLPSMHFDHWFSRHHRPRTGRALAEEIIAELQLGDTPGLAAALDAARDGQPVVVTPDSELGRHVREWSMTANRASCSLNDPWARGRMGEEERKRAFRLGHLVAALGGAFRPDLA